MGNFPAVIPEKPPLFQYAYIGKSEETLKLLKEMAMEENWDYSYKTTPKPFPILFNYLLHTFTRVQEENKIAEKDLYSCFNTGLATTNQQDIFMVFKKSGESGKRFFHEFCKESDRNVNHFSTLPERASFFDSVVDLMYDPKLSLRLNIDHIVDDPENFARFPESLKSLPKHQLINTFHGAVEHAKKRVKRNYLTAIPQFYRGKYCPVPGGQLQLLLPLCLTDPSKADLALAIYRDGEFYSGRTCLTLDMAINNARLITKPDDEWLKP